MDTLTKNREQIIESIKTLPEDSLTELINFVDYLPYKATEKQSQKTSRNFLLSIAALGNSVEKDVSERDEEILANEVDPIRGWSLHRDRSSRLS
ncbi:DUF2281 domain-containing protein [Dolichospermum sp. UHCC 0259]|uniref:DUF2281 domain-containing protein n=1 Tax=Dolichospermum sp. UHCC 0259 TaxID=2590010 RepID=UPI001445E8B8|nr:DUF2281 domain-containing protein [Dolichospermum sp. UHCC 0259]MTJ50952.1 DUF2281 domain-containing protein [Dolichospermum sp. UHCC 0259]